MTFAQHIRLVSFDDLLLLTDIVQTETTRRKTFIDCLSDIQLQGLSLTINTRDLLYRVINSRLNGPASKKNGDLTIKNLFTLLKKEDWLYIEYVNSRAFLEIKDTLIRHDAPLEEYYGVFNEKNEASLNRRMVQIIEAGTYK
ncbi:hypothetical protein [Spirosoma validum]|uniref:Uncharacterized protein n=1 Tax=Spirosoma validum TaxID=2771355 RepID=A0A927B2V2_9BACT|nr:hypothetical protein [Spirosoma validum]MBD2754393.1 hypothetical protein [Spirosoma validum]